jgi:hypothetical protein
MQPYKGYFIDGSALMVHPFSPDWYVCGSLLVPGPLFQVFVSLE